MRSAVAEVLGKQAEAGLADAMRHEYETVAQAGLALQVDCPDLAMGRHIQFTGRSIEEFRYMARLHVEALNHALANIPPDLAHASGLLTASA